MKTSTKIDSGSLHRTLLQNHRYDRVLDDSEITTLAGRASRISRIQNDGTNVGVTGDSGPPDGNYYVLSSTNLAVSFSQWAREATNRFDINGSCVFTNLIDTTKPAKFIRLQLP